MSDQQFYVGQIFEGTYPKEAANYCNANRKMMEEISPNGDVRRFQIQDIPAPTEEEQLNMELYQKEEYLKSTDWMLIRYVDTGVVVPADIVSARQAARVRIDEIRARLGGIRQ